MIHKPRTILLIVAATILQGCGNAYDSVSVQEWSEVGKNLPPLATLKGELHVKVTHAGTGEEVKAGDLVNVSIIKYYTSRETGEVVRKSSQRTLWLWVGQEPEKRDWKSLGSWGDLGSPRLRKQLIGRAVGEKMEIKLDEKAEGFVDVPLYGFTLPLEKGHTLYSESMVWPSAKIGYSSPKGAPLAEIEILDTCRGHLYRRSGVIKQWGYVQNAFEENYKKFREGIIRWSAVEGACGPGNGVVRLEIGPIYFYKNRSDLSLYNWTNSYRSHRSREKYPEDYKYVQRLKRLKQEALREVTEGPW